MMRSFARWGFLALALGAASPAQAQNYALIGAWRCQAPQIVYDVVFNADGYYSGNLAAANGFNAYSEGPYRLAGRSLRIDFLVWETQPQQTPNPGGDTYQVQFQGSEGMSLCGSRCAQGAEGPLSCVRHR